MHTRLLYGQQFLILFHCLRPPFIGTQAHTNTHSNTQSHRNTKENLTNNQTNTKKTKHKKTNPIYKNLAYTQFEYPVRPLMLLHKFATQFNIVYNNFKYPNSPLLILFAPTLIHIATCFNGQARPNIKKTCGLCTQLQTRCSLLNYNLIKIQEIKKSK